MMAQTKASATYAAIMLSLLSSGLAESIGMLPRFTAAPTNAEAGGRFPAIKVTPAVHPAAGAGFQRMVKET